MRNGKKQKIRHNPKIFCRDKVFGSLENLKKLHKEIVNSKIGCITIKIMKNCYKLITVITTLFAFICIPIFGYGLVTRKNISDNDLLMQQVKEEAGDGVITSLDVDRKSTRLNSSHTDSSRMPSSA